MGARVSNGAADEEQGEGPANKYRAPDSRAAPQQQQQQVQQAARRGEPPAQPQAARAPARPPGVPDLAGRARRKAAVRALWSRKALGGYIALVDVALAIAAVATENWASLPARPLGGATAAGLLRIRFADGRSEALSGACTAVGADGDAGRCPAVVGQVSAAALALLLAGLVVSFLAALWVLFLGRLLRRSTFAAALLAGLQDPTGGPLSPGPLATDGAVLSARSALSLQSAAPDAPVPRFQQELAERRRRRRRLAEGAAAWLRLLPAALYAAAAATYGAAHGRQFTRTAFGGASTLGPGFWLAVAAACWSALSLAAPPSPGAQPPPPPAPDEDARPPRPPPARRQRPG
eukprot:tig00000692_g3203.t1